MAERKAPPAKSSADQPAPGSSPRPAAKKKPTVKPADHGSQDDSLYTDPDLRARLKHEIQAANKGGRAGQWSARKSQLLVHTYEAQGGGYTKKEHAPTQKNLKHWTEEKWQTANGEKAVNGDETARYLPGKAWDELSPAEKKGTDRKKRMASKKGEQFVANTEAAKKARKKAVKRD